MTKEMLGAIKRIQDSITSSRVIPIDSEIIGSGVVVTEMNHYETGRSFSQISIEFPNEGDILHGYSPLNLEPEGLYTIRLFARKFTVRYVSNDLVRGYNFFKTGVV